MLFRSPVETDRNEFDPCMQTTPGLAIMGGDDISISKNRTQPSAMEEMNTLTETVFWQKLISDF